ncbi:MAG: alpha/beta hydrolase [Chloroflexi bacterium]|nr:alpha/beta hydrolase [Chloroflexota bacterium]
MSAITINGDLVHYEVLGRGKPIILLHSWLGSWRYWIPAMQQLSVKYRTYAVDFWGFGDSGHNTYYYDIDGQVELLHKFLERMGIPKAVFIGHGLGAAVTAFFAVRPESRGIVHRQMVIAPPLFSTGFRKQNVADAPPETVPDEQNPDAATVLSVSTADRQRILQAAMQYGYNVDPNTVSASNPLADAVSRVTPISLLSRHVDTSSTDYDKLKVEVEKADEAALKESTASLSKRNPLGNLLAATAPTLVVMGDSDSFITIPEETILSQLAERDKFKLIVLPNTRHFPMLEDTTRFTRLVREFLEAADVNQLEMKDEWRRRQR